MGGGFFGFVAGGFLGYYLAKDRSSEHHHGWHSGRGWGRCQQHQQNASPVGPVPVGITKSSQPTVIASDEYAQFQEWKQQQETSSVQNPPFPSYAQVPSYNVESVKASAVESADKALDVILSQVQGMKQKLAQHKVVVDRAVPSSPQSEAGDYKIV